MRKGTRVMTKMLNKVVKTQQVRVRVTMMKKAIIMMKMIAKIIRREIKPVSKNSATVQFYQTARNELIAKTKIQSHI